HLAMRVRQMLLGADDVRDLHLVIVDDDGEVVRRQAVGADADEVAERFLPPRDLAADQIVDGDVAVVRHVEAQRERRPHRELRGDLLRREAVTRAVVVRRTLRGLGALALELQLLLGAEAAVGGARRQELLRGGAVVRDALGLPVGRVRAAGVRPFAPLQTEPAEIAEDHLLGLARGALDVRVLDAEDERAAVPAGEEPVENGGARAADVEVAGRRGGEADADGHAGRSLSRAMLTTLPMTFATGAMPLTTPSMTLTAPSMTFTTPSMTFATLSMTLTTSSMSFTTSSITFTTSSITFTSSSMTFTTSLRTSSTTLRTSSMSLQTLTMSLQTRNGHISNTTAIAQIPSPRPRKP